jgi:hypothetical protein
VVNISREQKPGNEQCGNINYVNKCGIEFNQLLRRNVMASKKTWKTVVEATAEYRMETSLLLKWAEQGMIRVKEAGTRSMRVRSEDLEMKMGSITGLSAAH